MATVKALLDAGQLHAAIEEAMREVKAHPADQTRRMTFVELLCFAGEWERAEKQLAVIGQQTTEIALTVQVYSDNIRAEQWRRRLWRDGLKPVFLSEPPEYVNLYLNAANRIREGNWDAASELLDQAENERPALAGKLNGQPFEDFRDGDDWIAPVLELFVREQYIWLPFEQIQRVELDPPKYFRDLLWAKARIETTTGTTGEVFLPALYAGSHAHANEAVQLGRMTDWQELAGGVCQAAGQRVWLADEEEIALLDARTLEFDIVAGTDAAGDS